MLNRVEIRNVLGIELREVDFDKINILVGDNGTGKTSFLEALEKLFTNGERRANFIRTGSDTASIHAEMTVDGKSVIADKTFKRAGKDTTKLKIEGDVQRGPETLLKELIGIGKYSFSLNPVDFVEADSKEQVEILLSLMKIELSPEKIKEWCDGEFPAVNLKQNPLQVCRALTELYYNRRHQANADAKALNDQSEALTAQLPDNYDPEEWRELQLRDKYEELHMAEQINANREKAASVVAGQDAEIALLRQQADKEKAEDASVSRIQIADLEEKIEKLMAQIIELQNQQKTLESNIATEAAIVDSKTEEKIAAVIEKSKKAKEYLDRQPAIDTAPMKAEAEEAERMKGFVQIADQATQARTKMALIEELARQADEKVTFFRQLPHQLFRTAEKPITGMDVDDEGNVTLPNLKGEQQPLQNLSQGEQILAAIQIAEATSGPLGIILVDEFQRLDDTNQRVFIEAAQKSKYRFVLTATKVADGIASQDGVKVLATK